MNDIDAGRVRRRALTALLVASAMNVPFGTIYAFSVFLRPMEQQLGVSRTEMSVVFATATVALAAGMNLMPVLARRIDGAWLIAVSGLFGALGIMVVSQASGFWLLLAGYGLMFGLGGGVSFTAVQQSVNQAMPRPSGLANGYVVSLYPIGAMVGAPVFSATLFMWGIAPTLWLLAATLTLAGVVGGWLFRRSGLSLVSAAAAAKPQAVPLLDPVFVRLFIVFFLAASAGMMVLGQAAAILHAYGAGAALAAAATTVITGVIAASRVGGGWLVDHLQMRTVAVGANLLALMGAGLITAWPTPVSALIALSLLGMGYGLMSGSSAGYVPRIWSRDLFATLAARLYVAWCLAALCLPVLAGWLFDLTGGYQAAVLVAAAGNLAGAWCARRIALALPDH